MTTGKRVNHALRPAAARAMTEVAEQEGVTDTEAVHILIKYGKFLRDAARDENSRILIERNDEQFEVILL